MQNREAKQCIVYSIGGVVNWVMLMMHPSMIEGKKKLNTASSICSYMG